MINKLKEYVKVLGEINKRTKYLQESLGRIETRQVIGGDKCNISSSEFKVYSQWGEDGLIQYLINNVEIDSSIFVEFGVETFTEANCRFLMIHNNWAGLVIDGSQKNIDCIKSDPIYWRYNLKAECSFIDKENINNLIQKNGITGDIGILSVDIDGNDYWVWDAIDIIRPRIVICEYNSLFGAEKSVSTPYSPSFYRTDAHYSNLYYGASVAALTRLANSKGYALVAGNKAGNNIFFVRRDLMGVLEEKKPKDVYVESQFRESRCKNGQLTLLPMSERLKLLKDMPIVNIENMKEVQIGELYGID